MERRNLQKMINLEFHKTLSKGLNSWKPSKDLKKRKTLSYKVQKGIYDKFYTAGVLVDSCFKKSNADDNETQPNYGLRLSKIKCKENDE